MNAYSCERRTGNSVLRSLTAAYAAAGLILARSLWYLWFAAICFSTFFARMDKEPISDSAFAQGTGIVSAIAILLTLHPWGRSQRLHGIMLALCCLVYFGLQRPMASTPHGIFLRSFKSVQEGMTVTAVRTRMRPYSSFASQTAPALTVDTAGVRQWWLRKSYSGTPHFNHNDPDSIDGLYDVTFTNGKVTKILFYND